MNSFKYVNYTIRPQKRIERALFSEVMNSLSNSLGEKINYVGMGSLYFADFTYFRKTTRLDRMISLEFLEGSKEEIKAKKTRFDNNKPLNDIELIMEKTSQAIDDGSIPFESNNFIWFDYDNEFNPYYIYDLSEIVRKTKKTSLFAITYNTRFPKDYWKRNDYGRNEVDIDKIKNDYEGYFPEGYNAKDLDKNNYHEHCANILKLCMDSTLDERNDGFKLEELSTILYGDGVEMKTILWILYDNAFKIEDFKKEIRNRGIERKMNLKISILTLYEKQLLDRSSQKDIEYISEKTGLEKEVIEQYYKYSKYIPEYSEIIF